RPNLGDATDETFGDDGRHLLSDAVGAAAIDGEGPGPPSAFAADDLAGERSERKPVAKGEKTPQPAILLIRLANLQRLHTETLVVRPEGRVLAPDRSPVREGVPGAEGSPVGLGEHALNGIEGEGEQISGSGRSSAPRLHGEEDERGEQHPGEKSVVTKSHQLHHTAPAP